MTTGTVIKYIREFFFLLICILFLICMLYACASVGSPQGGPIDETPPRFVRSTPAPNALNVTSQRIEIEFDELITLENPMEGVIVTPPQMQFPVIKAVGRKVVIELKDSLQPNMTYTIDFGNTIADNNEKNVLENFTFAFSTGDVVDSLVVSGALLYAANLEPMPGILVGLHRDLSDTAFTQLPFFRTSKTGERGRFWIRNIAPGTYQVRALNDLNRDYRFDQPGEEIAFLDSFVTPSYIPSIKIDTIWKDSLTVDTIIETHYNRFVPDDVVLFLFKENFSRQYLRKAERTEPRIFALTFNAPVEELPDIRFLNAPAQEDFAVLEVTEGGSTLRYWLRDSLVYRQDTLDVEVSYLKSDTANLMVMNTDTFSLFVKKPKQQSKKKDSKKDKEEEKIDFLGITVSASSTFEVFDTLKVRFSEPLAYFDSSHLVLRQRVDSVRWDTVPFRVLKSDVDPMLFQLLRRWDYDKEYKLTIDSAIFTSMYGKWNDKLETTFKTRPEDSYGHLYFNVSGVEGPGFGQLLDASDKPVRQAPLKDGGLLFMNLKPSKYYLRYIVDSNDNGVWDTGQYDIRRQPEQVFYYHTYIEVPQNWRIEQNWDVREVPITQQKPLEITKNKPKERKKNNVGTQGNSTNNTQRQGSQNSRLSTQGR